MEVLEMFLRDMGVDVDISEDGGVATALSSDTDFDIILGKVQTNSYYYNKCTIKRNKLSFKLRGYDLGVWAQYRLEVTKTEKGTEYTCWVIGYETVLNTGVVILTDSIASKNRFEV